MFLAKSRILFIFSTVFLTFVLYTKLGLNALEAPKSAEFFRNLEALSWPYVGEVLRLTELHDL
jgi:hypothetical protein